MRIEPLTGENKADLHAANQPFDVIGTLVLRFADGRWQYDEVLWGTPWQKKYPNYDGATAEDYVGAEDRAAYLVYDGVSCIGQILLARSWNGYAHIEDISVAAAYRGRGIGTCLLAKAEAWAREKGLDALSLECQDNNVLAARFYQKNGFAIGGVNTRLYAQLGKPYNTETAVFWYKTIV